MIHEYEYSADGIYLEDWIMELWFVEGNVKTVAEKLAIYIHTHIISRQNTLEAIFHLIKFVEP